MESSHFFAMLARMKYINRWGLMNNTKSENISEHSLQVAMLAHLLATISNKRLNNNYNAERAALLGLYHDSSEIITGDMPTPVKYFNPEIIGAYKKVEKVAQDKLLSMLPDDLKETYCDILFAEENEKELWKFVKAADKLSALIKCIEEIRMGNAEFEKAHLTISKAVEKLDMQEVKIFCEEFLPSYYLTLDELE